MKNTSARKSWGRALAIVAAILFFVSSIFPAVAGLSKSKALFPKWWGVLDVTLAFFLAILAFIIMALADGSVSKDAADATYRAYRVLLHGILAILVLFFLFGDRITWSNCLTGFAWRAWLLTYSLPAWFTVLGRRELPDIPTGE